MKQKAFTLLELAVVLTIIGVIISGGLVVLTAATQSSQVNATVAKMDVIHKALLDYTNAFYRLPCPADLTLAVTDTNYGKEAASVTNSCYSGTPSANFKATGGVVEGAVPVRTLQLPDSIMYDAWGHKFRYAVVPGQTATGSFPPAAGGLCAGTQAITVKDAAGANRTTSAVYALLSHGAVGHGGYTKNGTVFAPGSSNTDDLTNCHCDGTTAAAGTYTATYVQKLPTQNSAALKDKFDDIVSFREAWQMQNGNIGMASACAAGITVCDLHGVRLFTPGGNINSITGDGSKTTEDTGMPAVATQLRFYDPEGIVYDSAGNWYGADSTYHIIVKVDASTGVMSKYAGIAGSSGSTGDGGLATSAKLNDPSGIAIDSAGNIYIADTGNNKIRKITAATGIITTIAGTGNASYNGDNQIATNAQLNLPTSVAVDASNNVFISDSNNYRIRVIYSADSNIYTAVGTGTVGSGPYGGVGTGVKIQSPTQIALDSTSSNLYITDLNTHVVLKMSTANTNTTVYAGNTGYGFAGMGGAATSATLGYVMGITVDSSNNVYFTDTNKVVYKVASGTGIITVVAGTPSTTGGTGDGGPATSATFVDNSLCLAGR